MVVRKSILADIMRENGVTIEEVVNKVYQTESDRQKGIKQLSEVLEYREVNMNLCKTFAEAAGGTQEQVQRFLNDVKYFVKVFKGDLDKKINATIAEIDLKADEEKVEAYAEHDPIVTDVTDNQVYNKGTDWVDAQLAEKAKRSDKPKKVKSTSEEPTPAPEETPIAGDSEADLFN